MARLVTICLFLLALTAPASALGAVQINDGGYDPAKLTINPGSVVTWHYNNLVPHGVEFQDPSLGQVCPSGVSGFAPDCQKQFPSAGRFPYHDIGCDPATDVTCIAGQIVVYVPPTSSFTPSATSQLRGQAIDFDGSGSTSPGGSLTAYNWDFGDGTGASGPQTSHVFTTAGTYTVKLSVTDDQGNVAVSQQDVTITVPDSDGDGFNDDNDKCASNPGIAPDGCPFIPPVIPGPIVTSSVAARELNINGALKSGVTLAFNCSSACTGLITLTRDGRTLAVPQTATIPFSGSTLVTLKFTSSAKRLLAKAKNPRLLLQVEVTDALGRKQTTKNSIVLRQVKTFGRLPAIGISDNNQTTFNDPNFQVLKLRYARLVTPYDSIFSEPDRLDAWLQAARAHGIRPLVSFQTPRGMICPGKKCKGPSKAKYTKAWKAFHKKYSWVKDISPWNEVNSATQPTGKRPDLAALYYNIVRASCRGCTIVAADLLDSSNIRRYSAAFLAKAKGKPRLWGLHNYTDTNRFRSRGTKALLATVKGTVWLTETGGVVKFVTQKGVVALPHSESRARKAMDYMFRLAEQNASRIKRIYVYQWKVNNAFDRFDAGVVRPDGTPRPSFQVLSVNASIAAKH